MAWEQPVFNMSYKAGEDLSSYQFQVVKLTTVADTVNRVSSEAVWAGVLQDKPTSGREANIMVIGVSKVAAGGAISKGQKLNVSQASTANAGRLIANSTGQVVGVALEAAATAGDIITAIVNFFPGNVTS
jgi:hypothetical protein